ncbi:hypothetical protein Baya_13041 [Bagarius yarrelli]|uniref:Uncharacterized protein n=1 Tax=Bagarius yarrelli TaxID=175774 RepID=A0A556V4T8_BAGYA|nr:hypothetical protein Baya_13041 [Bagarius yarrelli]
MQISEQTCNGWAAWTGFRGDDESSVRLEEQPFLTDLPHSHGAFIHPPSFKAEYSTAFHSQHSDRQ